MGLALLEREGEDLHVLSDGPEERLSAAMGLVNAATAEVVACISAAVAGGDWQGDGITTIEQWVALRAGVSGSRARRLVAAAGALADLPAASAAFTEGALSEDQVAVICRHVDAAHDGEVTELARRCTVAQLRRILPSVVPPEPEPDPEPDTEPDPHTDPGSGLGDTPGRRETTFGNHEDGLWWSRVLLPPDEGALVQKALEASRSALFNARHPSDDEQAGEQSIAWSDALVHMAEAALSNIEGTGRLPADRYQVVFHVNADQPDVARLHLGPHLPPRLVDYLRCDSTGRVVLEQGGTPVHVFARQRTVDDRLRALIEHRDGGCRVPGCGQRRWLHVHHIVHHKDGGLTVPANLCCLCPAHHRLHHAGRLGIEGDPTTVDGVVFTDRRGRPIRGPSPRPPGGPPPEAAAAMGLPSPRWNPPIGERMETKWISWS